MNSTASEQLHHPADIATTDYADRVKRADEPLSVISGSPEISVILPTIGNPDSVRRTVRAIHAQTIRDRVELIVICPTGVLDIPSEEIAGLARVLVVAGGQPRSSNYARLKGIRAASAPIVALSEDHCFPSRAGQKLCLRHTLPNAALSDRFFKTGIPRACSAGRTSF